MSELITIIIFCCFYWWYYYNENNKASSCIFIMQDLLEEIVRILENKTYFLDILYDTSIKGYILILYDKEEFPIVIRLFSENNYSGDYHYILKEHNYEIQKNKIIKLIIRELKYRLENYKNYKPYHYSDFYKTCPIEELERMIKENKPPF